MERIKKNMYFAFVFLFLFTINIIGVKAIAQDNIDNYRIRVGTSTNTIGVKANTNYKIYIDDVALGHNVSSSNVYEISKNNASVQIKVSGGTVLGTGNKIEFKNSTSNVQSIDLNVSGSYVKYPDNMRFSLSSDKSVINCINVTDIETYLKGVLPYEMGVNAPLEALKAQAVTARTVAVSRVNKYNTEGYDIRNDTSDQVYKGYNATYNASTHNISKAVEQTRGVVLKYGSSLVSGTFYSNNGGMTISDANVWSSGVGTPYYKSKVDSYDTYLHPTIAGWSKLKYTENYTAEQLRNVILNSSIQYPGYFKGSYMTPTFDGLSENYRIEVKNSVNGYVTLTTISDDKGRVYNIKNYSNRWVFGLRSQQFTMTSKTKLNVKSSSSEVVLENMVIQSDSASKSINNNEIYVQSATEIVKPYATDYVFNGAGYGHGIGMSQNGAMNRADAGHTYKDILAFYYDGTNIANNYGN